VKPVIIFLFVIICFWSLITTITAIIKILSNDFKSEKSTWIIISMIAFIGPILWLRKGRNYVVKKKNNFE
jgi:hypothetical protein